MTSKKRTSVGAIVENVKTAAAKVVDGTDQQAAPKLFERIVPIPHIDTYSELPFALVETNGERVVSPAPEARKSSDAHVRSNRKKSAAAKPPPKTKKSAVKARTKKK